MDRTERFYRIDQLLHDRQVVSLGMFLEDLGVSRATFKRDLEYLRDRLNAPIVWDPERRGYRYETSATDGPRYALPGLWLNATEIHALLTMRHLLDNVQPGLLGPHLEPLLARVRALLDSGDHAAEEVERRIRILHMGSRPVPPRRFEVVSSGLLSRRRLRVEHYSRERDEVTERVVSPQRLVHYRDNWYVDAWCHLRRGLRSFAIDSLREVAILDERAREVSERRLDAELGSGYGIFAGQRTRTARLRFSRERSRWVADERWHPEQAGLLDDEGRYVLELPYSDDRELVMDILRHGPEIEVLAPEALRRKVGEMHAEAARRHHRDG